MDRVKKLVREIPNYPQEGIIFKDVTPVMGDPVAFDWVIRRLSSVIELNHIDVVVGVEARGFVFGAVVAHQVGSPFVPVRKPGKLPGPTRSVFYDLEYGNDGLEIHVDAIAPGARVAIVDDVLATGGTAAACVDLILQVGAEPAGLMVVLELESLGARKRLGEIPVHALIIDRG